MAENKEMDVQSLEQVTGGTGTPEEVRWERVIANVAKGYLALRNAPAYDDRNIIARIENGVSFLITRSKTYGKYVWACYNDMEGWVNGDYTASLQGGIGRA